MSPPLPRTALDLDDVLWAMHCAEGPVPRATVEAGRRFLEKELRPWELGHDEWTHCADDARLQASRILGASPADVTLAANTSAGLTTVAQTYPWTPGDEVLAPLGEFPSNIWPWKALASRGVGFREVPLWPGHRAGADALESTPPPPDVEPEARLLAALGPRTRLLTVSWARFQDGLLLDLTRLARGCAERGVALVVDGIQAAGVVPVDLEGVAAFATSAHKGLLTPQGAGFLWTHPSLRERLSPLGSWQSVEGWQDFARSNTDHHRAWLPDGKKLELAGMSPLTYTMLATSLRFIADADLPAIHAHVHRLQTRLLAGLARLPGFAAEARRLEALAGRGRLSPIAAVHHGGRGAAWLTELTRSGFTRKIFTTHREGYLRLALHGWHEDADVDRLLGWLEQTAPRG
jgi:cysteine desulfurase/selenocysteine lyase